MSQDIHVRTHSPAPQTTHFHLQTHDYYAKYLARVLKKKRRFMLFSRLILFVYYLTCLFPI